MKMTLSHEWNPVVKTEHFLDLKTTAGSRLIGKCRGELFSIDSHPGLIENILSLTREATPFESLARAVDLPRSALKPLIEALIDGQLLTVVDDALAPQKHTPYIRSVILTGGRMFVNEMQRVLELLGFSLPVTSLAHLSFHDRHAFMTLEENIRTASLPMLVGAPPGASLDDLLSINTLCLKTETPWLPLLFDGAMIRLGPTVIPYKTPCFGCLTVHLSSEKQVLFPEFSQDKAFSDLQETWPLPETGPHALETMRLIPDGAGDILALSTGKYLPALIGRQHWIMTARNRPGILETLTVEAQSRCPACYCGACSSPRTLVDGSLADGCPDDPTADHITAGDTAAPYDDGGLRSVGADEARKKITRAFAAFGPAFRVVRSPHGPLGSLPSYRSHCSGYLSRELPFLIPEKMHTGKGISEEQAFLSAAYEMAERVSASFHGQIPLVRARPSEVHGRALDITQCVGTQYLELPGLDRPQEDIPTDWVWARSLVSDRPLLVPASMVFFPMVRFQGAYKPQWSGGLAAGAELRDAVLQGLMERVEHDAWAVWQLNRIACPRIAPKTIPDAHVRNWLEHVRQKGFDVIIRDKRTELRIPTFRVWIISRKTPRVFAARGDGANPDPIVALKRALTEAQHKLAVEDESAWRRILTRPSLQLFEDELSLYHLSGLAAFELEANGPMVDFREITGYSSHDVGKDIRNTVERITARIPDAEIAVVDLTDPALGIPVVRVITSGLQEMAKPWTHVLPRTFRLPVAFGYYHEPLTYDQLYHGPFPHWPLIKVETP